MTHAAMSPGARADHAADAKPRITVDRALSLPDFAALCESRAGLELAPACWPRLEASQRRLHACIERSAVVYGVTTGFGPLANREVSASSAVALQRNLIHHLASGVGEPYSWAEARGVLLARLMSILQGWSGASRPLVEMMAAVINSDLAPLIPQKGTVGASGDLTPCAHMALALMGEGAFIAASGQKLPAAVALARISRAPHRLDDRDGLALVNGTSAMTAIAALTAARAARAVDWSIALSALHAEVMLGRLEAWRPAFGEARPHPGQKEAIERLNRRVADGGWADSSLAASRKTAPGGEIVTHAQAPQDPYTIRCVPQIVGAALDVLAFHDRVAETELNAATDNPIFGDDEPFALHGGNFYGQHVAFASDALAPALVKLAVLAERQIARVTDEKLSLGLPAFLQPRETGLQSGFMGAQVTSSALVAELRTLLIPASVQSIPTNGNNQDVVSMGTIAARKTRALFDDVNRIFAIQALALAQAAEIRAGQMEKPLSPAGEALIRQVRALAAPLIDDRPLSSDIEALADLIASEGPAAALTLS